MTHTSIKAGPGKYRSSVTRLTATCSTIELPDHCDQCFTHRSTSIRKGSLGFFTQYRYQPDRNRAYPCSPRRHHSHIHYMQRTLPLHTFHTSSYSSPSIGQNPPRELPCRRNTHRTSYISWNIPIAYRYHRGSRRPYLSRN